VRCANVGGRSGPPSLEYGVQVLRLHQHLQRRKPIICL
jgi:dihydroorotate dehydrogenase